MMKILVLGANGMAGHMISMFLDKKGYDVYAFAKNKKMNNIKYIIGDALDTEKLIQVIIENGFDYIVNCIGVLNSDCEVREDEAIYLNSYLPHLLARITKGLATKVIHLSTDCVFSGYDGPYYENSTKNGKGIYALSKSLGELEDDKNITIRTSIIGPDMNFNGIGLFNWFMNQQGAINGYSRVYWTGITTLTLAKAIENLLTSNISGIYHLVNNDKISKYDLLVLISSVYNKTILIKPVDYPVFSKELINTRADFKFSVPTYLEMLEEQKEWILENKELYHYNV
ncbi:dTDP-4-dehydrorhamnose reductase [Acholeplasma morum]|nr:dTDP-4-dehydrorhamnose reductase [Paracholeplasma morum]